MAVSKATGSMVLKPKVVFHMAWRTKYKDE